MPEPGKPDLPPQPLMQWLATRPAKQFVGLAVVGLVLACLIGGLVAPITWKLFRTLQVYWVIYLVIVASLTLPRVRQHWRNFIITDETPINLGIARIIIFATIYVHAEGIENRLEFAMSRGPDFFIPFKILDSHKIWPSYAVIEVFGETIKISAGLAMVGFMTRASSIWCATALFFSLGTINSFGKVDHTHHMLWMTAILAASPSGSSLSIDAALRGLIRGVANAPPVRHLSYGLALRAIWIQFGLLYLSAGIPKWIGGGLQWFMSDNLIYTMHERWYMARWMPEFRIDHYPLIVRAGGLGTIALELGAILLIVWGWRSRALLAVAAYTFHTSNGFILKLRFSHLQSLLPVLIDWQRIFAWLGERMFKGPLHVELAATESGTAKICSLGKAFDVFDTLHFEVVPGIEESRARSETREYQGAEVLKAVCRRTPILWPLLPIAGILPATRSPVSLPAVADYSRWSRSVAAIFLLLTIGNSAFTLVREKKGWPFSGYPSFKTIRTEDVTQSTLLLLSRENGEGIELPLRSLSTAPTEEMERSVKMLTPNELRASGQRMRRPEEACGEARRVWAAMRGAFPDLADVDRIDLFSLDVSTEPGRWDEELERTLLLQLSRAETDTEPEEMVCLLI